MGGRVGLRRAYLWAQTWRRSRDGCSRACLHAAERGAMRGCPPPTPPLLPPRPCPTSAWPPEVSVFPHFSHFRHGRCQSFPRDVTRSAADKQAPVRHWSGDREHTHPPAHPPSPATSPRALPPVPGGPTTVSDGLCTSSPLAQSNQMNGRGR